MRTPSRDGEDQRHAVQARDQAAWWDWTWCVARQMARLPEGRLVVRWEGFERKGDAA